ncbi:MAG: tyrosine--tRNA ligase [Chloroflexi bacterium]|nr:tyrosine--tRNA ligase [Chloroflexota bacterium]
MRRVLKRGVSEIIVESDFVERLRGDRPLRLKMGFDPSATDIHMGHAVGLRKLRQLQDLGHKVVLIVGDWTAQIGDPSGRSATRPMLTAEQVRENAATYMAQFFKIVDRDRTETRWQSEWFGDFSLTDVIGLTSRFTVAQFLARDDFANRFKANQPIAITELLYPLLQAYDSVAIESDVEFGGTDQMFNLLVGRDLQGMVGQTPQQCFLMPLLSGTDGVQKMSKSLGNYIGIDEPANEIYGKTMSLPDEQIVPYSEYLTDIADDDINEMREALSGGTVNPMELKKQLARELVSQFHDSEAALESERNFERTVQGGGLPEDIEEVWVRREELRQPNIQLKVEQEELLVDLSQLLTKLNLSQSNSAARRFIEQGAVRIVVNGHIPHIPEPRSRTPVAVVRDGAVVQRGRRWYKMLRLLD